MAIPLTTAVVVLGQITDGGALGSLFNAAAALIVLGGTICATFVSYSPGEVVRACRAAVGAFADRSDTLGELSAQLVAFSIRVHRRGLHTLEADAESIGDPFLRKGLMLAVDGVSVDVVREILNLERRASESEDDRPARIFEAAAGYAPTLGILGAVLGLINVMQQLDKPGALGAGIAVAFVATIYGVGLANLLLLPIAGRLRERAADTSRRRELIIEALVSMQQRMNPRLVEQKIRGLGAEMPALEEIAARLDSHRPPMPASRPS
jgi:chemotaxis protein MotA